MPTRVISLLLVLAAVVTALTPRGRIGEPMAAPARAEPTEPVTTRTVASEADSLQASLDVTPRGAGYEFALTLVNAGDASVEVRFPDGQTHEFEVRDARDRVLWRWSERRMFTQMLRTRTIVGGGALRYAVRWTPSPSLPAGRYVVVATLRSDTHGVALRQPLDVTPVVAQR